MKIKYEVASEKYRDNQGVWELYDTPQQVAMFESLEDAVKACGPFKKELPDINAVSIEVYTLYELQMDESGDVVDEIERAYKIIK